LPLSRAMTAFDLPPPRTLRDGIHVIPAPLPFKSPPWVNVYAIEDEGGILLLDCGADWPEGRAALSQGLADLGLDERAVHTLLVSHLHPDHVGMADRLREELGCRLVMHERAATGRLAAYNDTPGFYEKFRRVALDHGVPATLANAVTHQPRPDYMPVLQPPDHLVADGDTIALGGDRRLAVLHTPGHDDAHICLRDSTTGILFSGDHILPRISPVIMYDPDIEDVLGDYMVSLRRLIDLGIGLTYPAHGTIIDRGDERARQILLHHDRRLLDMADLVRRGPTNAFRVMVESFRPHLDEVQTRLAFLETIAHLEHLRLTDRIRRDDHGDVVAYLL
jgi:glyoxylase-like metal-dependent hydrolase (beta-lactamase superfamily II)